MTFHIFFKFIFYGELKLPVGDGVDVVLHVAQHLDRLALSTVLLTKLYGVSRSSGMWRLIKPIEGQAAHWR